MVYESDFYTTRRPYSSRPNVSSYSVTSPFITVPTVRKVTYTTTYPIYSTYPVVRHRSIPYIAHKRLVTGSRIRSSVTPARTSVTRIVSVPTFRAITPLRYSTPVRYTIPTRFPITPIAVLTSPANYVRSYTTRVSTSPTRTTFSIRTRPSIFEREYKRIENKVRSRPAHLFTDSYLNSDSVRAFDDATKSIRNDTNTLMRKIHQRVERAQSCLPASSYTAKYERRYGPDSFVSHLVAPLKSTIYNGVESWNPHKYIGKSHLASVRIVGNKAYNTRRATTAFDDDKVRNDVNLLSYYLKNRKAAAENKEPPVVLESSECS
ncbi:uncharacterized protein CG45076-like isoform X3 [Sitodiplosis mosellana]|uniref:uncharacterized protein CG45076-like isoform X3 n=1 Tax=Sitodiplosis mosellana TaxID=263140 RepID=UPI00244527BE|nr:uncharacterized protein CG45076-like isoform X3 [Sitodiplosis mosellana]